MYVYYRIPNVTDETVYAPGEPRIYSRNDSLWDIAVNHHRNEWLADPFAHYVYCIFVSLLSVVGTIGNILIVLSLLLMDALKKIQPIFIVNLSLTDLVITAFVMPINILGAVQGPYYWRGKSWLCDFEGAVCATACTASVWCIMGIAVERYFSICHISWYQRIYTPMNSILMMLTIWVVSFLIWSPQLMGWGVVNYTPDFYICTADLRRWTYSLFWAVCSVIIPTSICFYAYLQIYLRIRNSTSGRHLIAGRRKATNTGATNNRHASISGLAEEIRLIKALFRIFVIFLVSWTPLGLLFSFRSIYQAPKWLNLAALMLAHGNSATNAMVYFFMTDHIYTSVAAIRRVARKCCPGSAAATLDEHSISIFRRNSSLHHSQSGSKKIAPSRFARPGPRAPNTVAVDCNLSQENLGLRNVRPILPLITKVSPEHVCHPKPDADASATLTNNTGSTTADS
ncbi:melatonin receptor type 1B-B-like [Paramacrobiotus metropolitanus]|uniref:melatonin receptor type 1B-B-like n=1 Tax=Paramacrobiotus metropolitanus TaxID=2943436 RepID=UPI002445F6F4|nr:melatonin receptor type 1B-B-like [Paramacrobiotus metropolitanus]